MRRLARRKDSMRLAEYDGKVLLRRHGLAVPRGLLVQTGESFPDAAAEWPGFVLKAQVLEGGRGKRGLVRRFNKPEEFRDARRLILPGLEDADTPLLLEEASRSRGRFLPLSASTAAPNGLNCCWRQRAARTSNP